MSATVDSMNNGRSEEEGTSCNLFGNIIRGLANLCSCSGEQSSSSSRGDTQNGGNEQFLEINVGEEFARNLTETFSGSSSNLPTGFQPVITIPVALGRQLYEAYVESIYRQQEVQNQILADLIEEDEEFARQLQQEEDRYAQESASYEYVDVSDTTGILEERRQKRKKHEESPVVHRAKDTFDLHDLERPRNELFPEEYPGIYVTAASVDENDHAAIFYRDLAQQHFKTRNQFYQKAKKCLNAKNGKLANFYFQQAKEQTKLYEQANNFAAAAFLAENNDRHPSENTIDLHHLFVREAIEALDIFLDDEIMSLQNENLAKKSVRVVTGRGKHSVNGVPKIKPAVIERLGQRNLKYSAINPGLLKVYILKQSYLSNDLT